MARAWQLTSRPQGMPTRDNAALAEIALPELGDGMVHVRNTYLSVDPYMRGRMNDVKSYVPPFAIGEPMTGGAVGEVMESRDPSLQPGDMVMHMAGWRDEVIEPAANFNKLPVMPGVEPQGIPRQSRADRRHRLLRPARSGVGQGRRHRVRVCGGRRGRVGGGADRQGQGHDRDRIGRRPRQVRIRQVVGRRRSDRLQGRAGGEVADRRRAQGHRRLFRQCRWRPSRCRTGASPATMRASPFAG